MLCNIHSLNYALYLLYGCFLTSFIHFQFRTKWYSTMTPVVSKIHKCFYILQNQDSLDSYVKNEWISKQPYNDMFSQSLWPDHIRVHLAYIEHSCLFVLHYWKQKLVACSKWATYGLEWNTVNAVVCVLWETCLELTGSQLAECSCFKRCTCSICIKMSLIWSQSLLWYHHHLSLF